MRAARRLRQLPSALVLLVATASCGDTSAEDIPPDELVASGCAVDGDCPGGRCIAGIDHTQVKTVRVKAGEALLVRGSKD